MKFRQIFVFGLMAFGMVVAASAAEPGIIPRPRQIAVDAGQAVFRSGAQPGAITADASEPAQKAAALLRTELPNPPGPIVLAADPALAAEAYRLTVGGDGIRIAAADYAGFFNGTRTLVQLLRQMKNGELAAMTIEDGPRFPWRGVMLDVARHYFKLEFLYALVDQLAAVKMNVLHLHLTDDQGWRMEIKRYPLLTEKGAWRGGVDFQLEPESTDHYRADGSYGGFYTQEELKKLVAYAAARNITIVPEIDIPGHSTAAIANYPELLKCDIKGGSNVYCAAQESSYKFLEAVLSEVFEVFPARHIVLGADEVRPQFWAACPRCQQLSRDKGFKTTDELQHYFVTRVADFCRSQGRQPTGWDEIILGSAVMPEVTVMTRFDRGEPGVRPAEQGREMVIMKTSTCYFDYAQGRGEPKAIGIRAVWEKTYGMIPFPPTLAADKQRFILGVEGALWTEYVPNEGHAGYMLFPRTLALAEVGWTPPERMDEADFRARLHAYFPVLDASGISYRPDGGLVAVTEADGKAALSTPVADAEIYYTLDRSYPTKKSIRYTGPFAVDGLTNLRVAVFGRQGNSFPVIDRTVGVGKWSVRAPEAKPDNPPELVFDDDINSLYYSAKPFEKGAEIQLDFERPQRLSGIRVVAARGLTGGRSHFIGSGRLLVSADGETFTEVSKFRFGVAEFEKTPMTVKSVRIVADETVKPGLMFREISFRR